MPQQGSTLYPVRDLQHPQTPSCVLSLTLRAHSLRNSIFYTKKTARDVSGYKKNPVTEHNVLENDS